jgi:hypothetical protein
MSPTPYAAPAADASDHVAGAVQSSSLFGVAEDAGFRPPPPKGPPPPQVLPDWGVDFAHDFSSSSSSSNTNGFTSASTDADWPSASTAVSGGAVPHTSPFQSAEVPQALADAFFPPSSGGLGEDIAAAASSSAAAFCASFAHGDNALRTDVFPDSFLSAAASHPPQLSDLFSSSISATNAFATSDINALNSFSASAASDSPSALSISPVPQPADNSAPLSAQCDEGVPSGGDSAALTPLPPAVAVPPALPSWDSGLYEDGPHLNISTWGSDAEIGQIVSPKGQIEEVRIDTLVM